MRLMRLRFCAYSPVEYGLGVAIAQFHAGGLSLLTNPALYLHGVAFIWLKHVCCHFFNEYHD